ncbi:MAG: NAD-dependent protein deacylase [Oscillospiraceae bacterium]|nr:NAD-dependent protein deacylase [Oscillospiraceae bacterium]
MSIEKLAELLKQSNNIVFFGGAGVSTESNIPDFRSDDGIYNEKSPYKYPPEVMLSHSFYRSQTDEFYRFYFDKMIYKDAKPNPAHISLAKLEDVGKLKAVVTQNIDGLHQSAGSKIVYELHGSVLRNYCTKCGEFYDLDYLLKTAPATPICEKCGGIIKPDVVLYEEGLDNDTIEGAVTAIANADMLIVGGTSLSVYPAAGLIRYFRGKNLVLINKTATSYDDRANLIIRENIGQSLKKALELAGI